MLSRRRRDLYPYVKAAVAHLRRGRFDAAEQLPQGHLGSRGHPRVAERLFHQRHIAAALADNTGEAGPGPGQRGQRVEDRIVQEPLVLAAFSTAGHHHELLTVVPVRAGECLVGQGGPARQRVPAPAQGGGQGDQQERGGRR